MTITSCATKSATPILYLQPFMKNSLGLLLVSLARGWACRLGWLANEVIFCSAGPKKLVALFLLHTQATISQSPSVSRILNGRFRVRSFVSAHPPLLPPFLSADRRLRVCGSAQGPQGRGKHERKHVPSSVQHTNKTNGRGELAYSIYVVGGIQYVVLISVDRI